MLLLRNQSKYNKMPDVLKLREGKGLSTVELARQAFGSPGGKSKILKKILPSIPKHVNYVEPFAGGAAVFWNKDKVSINVLNDLDPEIAHAYKFIRDITSSQIEKLKQLDWTDSKEMFLYMRDKFNPKNDIQKFYKFLYTLKVSYGLTRKTFGFKNITKDYICGYLDRLPKLAEKLKGVKIFNTDYKEVIKKFDSPNTFFFIDPPYPEEWGFKTMAFSERQYQIMHDLLKSLKGKFCLTTNIRPWITKMFKDFNMRKVLVPRSFAHGDKPDYEWFVYNYDYKNKKLLQETGSGDIAGAPIGEKFGLQPIKIVGKKKKKKKLNSDTPKNMVDVPIGKSDKSVTNIRDLANYRKVKEIDRGEEQGKYWLCFANDEYFIVDEGVVVWRSSDTFPKLAKKEWEKRTEGMKGERKKYDNLFITMLEMPEFLANFKDIKLIKDFISVVGSNVKNYDGHKPNDIDLQIRMNQPKDSYLRRAIETRILKNLPEGIQDKIHFIWGDAEGSHDDFIPLYDLRLEKIQPSKKVEMEEVLNIGNTNIKLMVPYFPQKPLGSAYYDLDKIMEAFK